MVVAKASCTLSPCHLAVARQHSISQNIIAFTTPVVLPKGEEAPNGEEVVLPNVGAVEPKAADEAPNALPPKAGALPKAGVAVNGDDAAPYAGVPPNIDPPVAAPKVGAAFCCSPPGTACGLPAR